jgi:hypothetical protein
VYAKWKGLRVKREKDGGAVGVLEGGGGEQLEQKRRRGLDTDGNGVDAMDVTSHVDNKSDDDDGVTKIPLICPLDRMLLEAKPSTSSPSSSSSEANLLTLHWRDIKKNTQLRTFFNELAARYNRHLESTLLPSLSSSSNKTNTTTTQSSNNQHRSTHDAHDTNTKSNDNNNTIDTLLPTIFRVKGDDDDEGKKDSFYINTPLAEQLGQFRVVVDRDTILKSQRMRAEGGATVEPSLNGSSGGGSISEVMIDRYGVVQRDGDGVAAEGEGGKGGEGNLEFRSDLTRCTQISRIGTEVEFVYCRLLVCL